MSPKSLANGVLRLISRFTGKDYHLREVVREAGIAFMLRSSGAALSFGFGLLLARLVGASGAGVYYLAFTTLLVATVAGRMGLDNALTRFTAANAEKRDWERVAGVYRRGLLIASIASLAVTLLLVVVAPWVSKFVFSEPELTNPLRLMALGVLPMSLLTLHGQLLKGLRKIRDAMLVNGLGVPLVSVVLLVTLGDSFGVFGAVTAYVTATFLALLLGVTLWRRATPQLRGLRGEFDTRLLLATSLPLLWVASMNFVMSWTDTVMLGIWEDSTSVGVYGVVMRTALLSSFILTAVNGVVAPKFVQLYERGEMQTLGNLVRSSTRLMMLLALPLLLTFTVFSEEVLRIFGQEFVSGAVALAILSVGQFINVASGSAGYLLMMCGYEKTVRNNVLLSAGLNVSLNAVLIPTYGILGAAIATATALALKNLAAVYLIWRYLSIKVWTL